MKKKLAGLNPPKIQGGAASGIDKPIGHSSKVAPASSTPTVHTVTLSSFS
jgi:hypothetical protein